MIIRLVGIIVYYIDNMSMYTKKLLLVCTVAILLLTILYKCGKLPSASSGDEVWWSESGYFLANSGTLKWPMFDNLLGNKYRTYWPPTVAVVQSINFYIFGLNPFSMMLQSVFMNVMLLSSCSYCLRKLKFSKVETGFAAILLFVSILIERRYSYIRMENWIPIFFFVFYGIILTGARKMMYSAKNLGKLALGGFFIGLGTFSYYPQSPFFLLTCLAIFLYERKKLVEYIAAFLGFFSVVLIWLFWMDLDLDFLMSELNAYNTYGTSIIHLPSLENSSIFIEILSINLLICLIWVLTGRINIFGICCLLSSLSIFIANPVTATLSAASGVISLFVLIVQLNNKRIFNITILAGSTIVMLKFIAIASIVYYQSEIRNYSLVIPTFKQVFNERSVVGFSQYAWLGLRMSMGEGEIHFMAPSTSPQVYAIRSEKLKTDSGIETFTHFIVDPRNLIQLENDYPSFKKAIHNGRYSIVKRIMPNHDDLRKMSYPPYEFIIYERKHVAGSSL